MIANALSSAEAPEPTESATIQVRYVVDGREYLKELRTVVRKGERPESTLMLWYEPADPARATDKGISWLGLGLAFSLLAAAATGMI